MGLIQKMYPLHFSNFRIRYTQTSVEDVISEVQQSEIIIEAHIRAHRGIDENRLQILEKYYFPSMTKKIRSKINLCQTCKVNKYDRHPNKTDLQETPIPTFPGHTIHIDIYITNKHHILTAIDKFSKYALAKLINSRSMEDIRKPLRDMLFYFGVPKSVIMDNEKSFNSASILFMMKDELKIDVFSTPPLYERFQWPSRKIPLNLYRNNEMSQSTRPFNKF